MAKQQLSRRNQRRQSRNNKRRNKNQSRKNHQRHSRKKNQKYQLVGGEVTQINEDKIPGDYNRILCIYYKEGDMDNATITKHTIEKDGEKYKFPETEQDVKRINISGDDIQKVKDLKDIVGNAGEQQENNAGEQQENNMRTT
jgi:hypothetical protein